MEITYQLIKPIIVKEEFEENRYKLEFQAPNQKRPLIAAAYIKSEDIKFEEHGLLDKILSLFGVKKENKEPVIDEKVKEEAIVQAFKNFAYAYEYDENKREWIFHEEKL